MSINKENKTIKTSLIDDNVKIDNEWAELIEDLRDERDIFNEKVKGIIE